MFQETVKRCLRLSDISEIFVVTNESQKFFVLGQMEELGLDFPKDNLLIEPQGRNTLPAVIFGMHEIEKRFGSCVAGVFSSDHIMDIQAMDTIAGAEKLAHDYLVTFGIVPKSPHTGYGYINPGDAVGSGYKVSEFKEKPGPDEAREYVDEGYLWNSGMFLFDTDVFLAELAAHAPGFVDAFSSGDINEVTLKWEGAATLFNNALLIDEFSGKKIAVIPGGSYTFDMTGDEHSFRIVFN